MADRVGRKPMLIGALALASAATTLCAMAHSLEMLITLRFVAGIGLGGALPAVSSPDRGTRQTREPQRHGHADVHRLSDWARWWAAAVTAALLHLGWSNIFLGAGRRAFWLWPSRCCCPNRSNARLPTPPPGRG